MLSAIPVSVSSATAPSSAGNTARITENGSTQLSYSAAKKR